MIAIRARRLIDGTGRPAMENAVVIVERDRISAVGQAGTMGVPPEAELIDASDKVLMPGLLDCHVHVQYGGGVVHRALSRLAQVAELVETSALKAYVHARRDLRAGFTSVRDMGSQGYVAIALREAIASDLLEGPRMRASGQGLSITGGHMDSNRWRPEVTIGNRSGVADSPWAFRQAVRHQMKMGADCIKINVCARPHWKGPEPDEPFLQEMTREEIEAACDEAHKHNVRVGAHTAGGQGITDAILAGVDSLEHAHWLTEEQADLMAREGTFYVPTFTVVARQLEVGQETLGASDDVWNWLERAMEAKWESLARAQSAGVRIAVGTDAGFVVDHSENARELEFLVDGGLTPMEAIVAATSTAAELMDMPDVGLVQPGKLADLLIVNGDPLADIGALRAEGGIERVMKGGQFVQ